MLDLVITQSRVRSPRWILYVSTSQSDFESYALQARNVLGTPVPKVYAWSSRSNESTIGSEYIIMDVVKGVPLSKVWASMEIENRWAIVNALSRYQKAWTSISFNQFGGPYYAEDLNDNTQCLSYVNSDGLRVNDTKFCVGPSTVRDSVDYGRMSIEFDRGPRKTCPESSSLLANQALGNTSEDYHSAIGCRGMACINRVPQLPASPISLFGPGTYQPTREKKLKALSCYLGLIKYLLPTDTSIQSSSLMHGDLHADNIFVDLERPTEIIGIIDWQSTELAPLFSQARRPYILDYEGPKPVGLEIAKFPDGIPDHDLIAINKAMDLYRDSSIITL